MKTPYPLSVRSFARVLAVLAIAAAAGHLVQALAKQKPVAMAEVPPRQPTGIVHLSAGSVSGPLAPKSAVKVPQPTLVASTDILADPQPALTAVTPSCAVDLALDAQMAARIGVLVLAPCHAQERIVLRHAGLAVTAKLDAKGALTTVLPALVAAAQVEVMFADGTTVDGMLTLPEATTLRRFGVQWQGTEAFVVHGLQGGADYGQPGDISPANPGRPEVGSLMVLGDSTVEVPLLAQIYTFPAMPDLGAEVVIEAAVTAETCGHDLLAETIASGDGGVKITDLTLAMPECAGIGDFLVLKNLASDMKVAAN